MAELPGGMANVQEAAMPIQLIEGVLAADIGATQSIHEMPASHADVDLSTLTVEGLIKACPHYAGMAEINPELARVTATEDLGHAREEAKRQEGMSKGEKEDDFWSSISDLVEKQTEPKETAVPEEPTLRHKAVPAHEPTLKQLTEQDAPKPQPLVVPEHVASSSTDIRVESGPVLAQVEAQRASTRVAPGAAMHPEALMPHATIPSPQQLAAAMTRSAVIELGQKDATELEIAPHEIITATPESDAIISVVTEGLEDAESIEPTTISSLELGASELAPITAQEPNIRPDMSSVAVTSESDLSDAEQTPPLVLLERFTEALSFLANEASPQFLDEPTEFSTEYPPLDPPVAAVATEVVGKLTDLTVEQKEEVLPIVKSITEALQTIRQLQNEAAAPKGIIAAVEQMREQIVQLFEAIGIDYDEQKIEYFIHVMLAPNFIIRSQMSLTPEELAKMGTHEVKLASQFTALLSQTTTQDDTSVLHRLGKTVLLFVHTPLVYV